jgi:uncharacterized membrane protein HdeD (DUF308 family)
MIFSRNPVRAATAVTTATEEVLRDGKPVTDQLVADASLLFIKKSTKLKSILGWLLVLGGLFFYLPALGFQIPRPNLASHVFAGAGMWAWVFTAYYLVMLAVFKLLDDKETRDSSATMTLYIGAVLIASGLFNLNEIMQFFGSADGTVQAQAWVFTCITVAATGVSAYLLLERWVRNMGFMRSKPSTTTEEGPKKHAAAWWLTVVMGLLMIFFGLTTSLSVAVPMWFGSTATARVTSLTKEQGGNGDVYHMAFQFTNASQHQIDGETEVENVTYTAKPSEFTIRYLEFAPEFTYSSLQTKWILYLGMILIGVGAFLVIGRNILKF